MEESPAVSLMSLVRENNSIRSTIGHAHVMQEALELAIKSGLKFNVDDFETMNAHPNSYTPGLWWMGERRESFYALACKSRNTSACRSYEQWMGRKPFTLLNSSRIYVGLDFLWFNEDNSKEIVTCTSFAPQGSNLVACSYTKRPLYKGFPSRNLNPDGSFDSGPDYMSKRGKILHRHSINSQDLKEHRDKLEEFLPH